MRVCVCVSQFSLPGEETLSFSCIMGDAASVTVCLFVNVVCVNNLCVYACLCACDILFVCVVHILCGSGGYNGSAWARKKRAADVVCERVREAAESENLCSSHYQPAKWHSVYSAKKKKKSRTAHTHKQTHT